MKIIYEQAVESISIKPEQIYIKTIGNDTKIKIKNEERKNYYFFLTNSKRAIPLYDYFKGRGFGDV